MLRINLKRVQTFTRTKDRRNTQKKIPIAPVPGLPDIPAQRASSPFYFHLVFLIHRFVGRIRRKRNRSSPSRCPERFQRLLYNSSPSIFSSALSRCFCLPLDELKEVPGAA